RIASVYAEAPDGLGGGFGCATTCADPDPAPPLPGDGIGGGCLTGSGFTVGSLSGDAVMLTTDGCCGWCVCFRTRNNAPAAITTIAIATSGQNRLRFATTRTCC